MRTIVQFLLCTSFACVLTFVRSLLPLSGDRAEDPTAAKVIQFWCSDSLDVVLKNNELHNLDVNDEMNPLSLISL